LFPAIVATALVLAGCSEAGTGIDWNVVVSGGIDRNALVSVKAEPADQELSQDTGNTVAAGSNLGFAVTIENTSGSRQRHVKVALMIRQAPSPQIVQTKSVDRINGGEQQTVVFRDLGRLRPATPTTVKAEIQSMFWEGNTANNSGEYQLIFAPGGEGVPGSGALHGTALASVNALPTKQKLASDTENTVTAGADLAFAVTVENTGDSPEVQVKVTLTIQQSPSPIVQTKTIGLINPGEQKIVVFRNLGQVQFATRTTLKVDVEPVPEEQDTANNSASYPTIFSLS
jgi:hypothetical protein